MVAGWLEAGGLWSGASLEGLLKVAACQVAACPLKLEVRQQALVSGRLLGVVF